MHGVILLKHWNYFLCVIYSDMYVNWYKIHLTHKRTDVSKFPGYRSTEIFWFMLVLLLVVRMIQPISIGYLIGHFNRPPTTDSYTANIAAIAMLLSMLLITVGMHHYMLGQIEIGFKSRVAVTTIIYSKVLHF